MRTLLPLIAIGLSLCAVYSLFLVRLHPSFASDGAYTYTVFTVIRILGWSTILAVAYLGVWYGFRRWPRLCRIVLLCVAFTIVIFFTVLSVFVAYYGDIPHYMQWENAQFAGDVVGHALFAVAGVVEWVMVVLVLLVMALSWYATVPMRLRALREAGQRYRRLLWSGLAVIIVVNVVLHIERVPHTDLSKANVRYAELVYDHGILWAYWGLWQRDQSLCSTPVSLDHQPDSVRRFMLSDAAKRPDHLPSLVNANVLMVQVESLDFALLNMDVNGQAVMPTLRGLSQQFWLFHHFYAQHSGGGSSDAELSSMTGLLPLKSALGLGSRNLARLPSLASRLGERGYTKAIFHANSLAFFHRYSAYQLLGFEHFMDADNYAADASGWYAQDAEFFRQSVDYITDLPEPFLSYLITMQSHGPFRNHGEQSFQRFSGAGLPANQQHYLATMHEVDLAIAVLFDALRAKQLDDNTLVVIYGDHSSRMIDPDKTHERVPLLLIHPALLNHRLSKSLAAAPSSHLDVSSTVLDVLGLPTDGLGLGRSLLREYPDRAVLLNNVESGVLRSQHNESQPYVEFSVRSDNQQYVDFSRQRLQCEVVSTDFTQP